MKLINNDLFVVGILIGLIIGVNGIYHIYDDSKYDQVLGTSSSHFGILLQNIVGSEELCTTANSLDVLVSKRHSIDPDFSPEDLVSLPEAGVRNISGGVLRAEVVNNINQMFTEMDNKNLAPLYVLSAFRSYKRQGGLKKNWIQRLGMQAERLSADAGHSEHQLGTTVDLSFGGGSSLMVDSDSWKWLSNNAHKFGFVMSYREDNSIYTGYDFEPWHWRYVGEVLATEIYKDQGRPERYYLTVGCSKK